MFDLSRKKEDPIISFIPLSPGMIDDSIVMPQRSNKFLPYWWKDIPRFVDVGNENVPTIKACPSFADYFSQGFIIPAWADATLSYDKETDSWRSNEAKNHFRNDYNWTVHSNAQFINHVDSRVNGKSPSIVFKANAPWRVITRPGWSVLQLPLFYHFNQKLTGLPGVIDTDIHHEINMQMFYFEDGETIKINKGDPLMQYIPFKRELIDYDVREANKSDEKMLNKNSFRMLTKFPGSGAYKQMQKQRDKETNE